MFIVNVLVFVGAIVVMVSMSWQLALGVLVVRAGAREGDELVPARVERGVPDAARPRRRHAHLVPGGALAGVRVVQAFNQEAAFRRRFRETNEQQFRTHLRAETHHRAITRRSSSSRRARAIAVILFYGGWLTGRDVVTVGTLAAFVLYLQNLFEPMQQMSQLFNTLQAAGAALHKLYGLLDEDVAIDERAGRGRPPGGRWRSTVDRVSFRYHDGGARARRRVARRSSPGSARARRARPARASRRSPS